MNDRDSFEAALDDAPNDAAVRLMYADWLHEQRLFKSEHLQRWLVYFDLRVVQVSRPRSGSPAWRLEIPLAGEDDFAEAANLDEPPSRIHPVVYSSRRELEAALADNLAERVNSVADLPSDGMLYDDA